MKQVTLEQATERLGDLIDDAVRGEVVVLLRDNRAVARLVAVEPEEGHPQFGSARGLIQMSDDFDAPLEDFREYME